MFGQSSLCTMTPRVRVMNPTIGSGGSGLQHLATIVAMLFTPSTSTPDEGLVEPGAGATKWRAPPVHRRRHLATYRDLHLAVGHLAALPSAA